MPPPPSLLPSPFSMAHLTRPCHHTAFSRAPCSATFSLLSLLPAHPLHFPFRSTPSPRSCALPRHLHHLSNPRCHLPCGSTPTPSSLPTAFTPTPSGRTLPSPPPHNPQTKPPLHCILYAAASSLTTLHIELPPLSIRTSSITHTLRTSLIYHILRPLLRSPHSCQPLTPSAPRPATKNKKINNTIYYKL